MCEHREQEGSRTAPLLISGAAHKVPRARDGQDGAVLCWVVDVVPQRGGLQGLLDVSECPKRGVPFKFRLTPRTHVRLHLRQCGRRVSSLSQADRPSAEAEDGVARPLDVFGGDRERGARGGGGLDDGAVGEALRCELDGAGALRPCREASHWARWGASSGRVSKGVATNEEKRASDVLSPGKAKGGARGEEARREARSMARGTARSMAW